jgi:hypothetical protein
MISMASAFTFSGCENILMSLWKVNDQASITLMDDFYGSLLDGQAIDVSLRAAKLRYLQRADELTADPAIWAPLVAYGTLTPVFRRQGYAVYWVIGLIGVVGLVALYQFKLRRRS